jgi:hypothetical protein
VKGGETWTETGPSLVTNASELRHLAADLDEVYLLCAMPFEVRRHHPIMAAHWLRDMAALRDAGVAIDTVVYLASWRP